MKLKRLILGLGTVALAVASAAGSYEVTLGTPMSVGNTQLKPGTYKVAIQGDMAVFTAGKTVVQAPATLETTDHKMSMTEVDARDSKITEIRLGGTSSKIVFRPATTGETGAH